MPATGMLGTTERVAASVTKPEPVTPAAPFEEMIATGRQKGGKRPWIGVNSMEEDGRLKVIRVSSDGPAEKAGIEPGDIILQLSGRKIDNLADFYSRLWSAGEPGVEVTLKVLKGSEVVDVKVRSIDRAENIRKKPTI